MTYKKMRAILKRILKEEQGTTLIEAAAGILLFSIVAAVLFLAVPQVLSAVSNTVTSVQVNKEIFKTDLFLRKHYQRIRYPFWTSVPLVEIDENRISIFGVDGDSSIDLSIRRRDDPGNDAADNHFYIMIDEQVLYSVTHLVSIRVIEFHPASIKIEFTWTDRITEHSYRFASSSLFLSDLSDTTPNNAIKDTL